MELLNHEKKSIEFNFQRMRFTQWQMHRYRFLKCFCKNILSSKFGEKRPPFPSISILSTKEKTMTIGINQAIRFSELIALGNFRGRKVKIDEMFHIQKLKIAIIIQY